MAEHFKRNSSSVMTTTASKIPASSASLTVTSDHDIPLEGGVKIDSISYPIPALSLSVSQSLQNLHQITRECAGHKEIQTELFCENCKEKETDDKRTVQNRLCHSQSTVISTQKHTLLSTLGQEGIDYIHSNLPTHQASNSLLHDN